MEKSEEPKIHCIALDKPPHDLVKGETEWKLCKVFSTLSKSKERIHREKNATRKYKPVVAFTVSNPSDTDRQTLNLNKGVVKDHLGFAINSETMVALLSGVLDKGSQWVLTTKEHLKHFSALEILNVDTFYENEFDVFELEGSLPSLFKLQSTSNRTEVALASPFLKHPFTKERPKKPKTTSKAGRHKQGRECKKDRNTVQKEVPDLAPIKSESDLIGKHTAAEDYKDPVAQMVNLKVKESFSGDEQEKKLNDDQKRDLSAEEQHNGATHVLIPKIKEEPSECDYKPNLQGALADERPGDSAPKLCVKVKLEEVTELDFKSKQNSDPALRTLGVSSSQVMPKMTEEVVEHVQVEKCKYNLSEKRSGEESHGESPQTTVSKMTESISESAHQTESQGNVNQNHSVDFGTPGKIMIKEVRSCGHVVTSKKDVNAEHTVQVGHQTSFQKTTPNENEKLLQNYHKAKPKSDLKKGDDGENCKSVEEGGQLSERQRKAPVSLAVKISQKDEKESSWKKHRPEERDGTINQSPYKKCASQLEGCISKTERKSDQDKGLPDLPIFPDLPSLKDSLQDTIPDPKVTLKVTIPKLDIDVSEFDQHFNVLREEQMEKHPEKERGLFKCSDEKTDKQTPHSAVDDGGAKISHPSLKRCKQNAVKEHCEDIKRRQTKSVNSKFKPLPPGERQSKPKQTISRILSVGPEKSKTSKEFSKKISHSDQLAVTKTTSNVKQTKESGALRKGVLKVASSVDCKPNREDHSTGRTKKRISFSEYTTVAKGRIIPESTKSFHISREDPPSAKFGLFGSLNTNESFLLDTESEKNPIAISSLRKALAHTGVDSCSNLQEVSSSNSVTTVPISKSTCFANLKRRPVTPDNDSQPGYPKKKRTDDQTNGKHSEESSSTYKQCESKAERRAKKQIGTDRNLANPNTCIGKQLKESSHVLLKSFSKAQRDLTLLVGDSMLQHIQPEKFFKNKVVCVKTVPGARVDTISEYITKFVRQENPSDVILHIGTNDLHKGISHIAAHIETVGKLITETFPGVTKFTISSIIQCREDIARAQCAKASEVNKTLQNLQLKHGWEYIDNENIDPEVHIGPDGIHLNATGIEAFAANISKHFGLVDINLLHDNDSLIASKDQHNVQVMQKDVKNSTTSCSKSSEETISSWADKPHNTVTLENNGKTASSLSQLSRGERTCSEAKGTHERVALLIGDLMLQSILPHKLSHTKQTELVVVPDARVDSIGEMIIKYVSDPKFDEVILHVGSNDLKDDEHDLSYIASKIEAIGLKLQNTFPNLSTFTISGVISSFQYKHSYSRKLNSQLKSLTSQHGWAFICNGNIYPKFHLKPFNPKLNSFGTRLLATNIIEHLRFGKRSRRRNTLSQCPKAQEGDGYQTTTKDISPESSGSKEGGEVPPEYHNHQESNDSDHVKDPETEKMQFGEEDTYFDQVHGQSERYPGKHMKPHSLMKGKRFRKTERGRSCIRHVSLLTGHHGFGERPNFEKAWSRGGYHRDLTRYNPEYSPSRQPCGARQGRLAYPRYDHGCNSFVHPKHDQNTLFPEYSGCYDCGRLDHKRADCPKRTILS